MVKHSIFAFIIWLNFSILINMNSQMENEVNESQLSPPWEDAQITEPVTFERGMFYEVIRIRDAKIQTEAKPFQTYSNAPFPLYIGLLLPQERESENPPEEKPKSAPKSYKRRSKKVLHEIEFAQSIANSINSIDHSLLLDEL